MEWGSNKIKYIWVKVFEIEGSVLYEYNLIYY